MFGVVIQIVITKKINRLAPAEYVGGEVGCIPYGYDIISILNNQMNYLAIRFECGLYCSPDPITTFGLSRSLIGLLRSSSILLPTSHLIVFKGFAFRKFLLGLFTEPINYSVAKSI